MPKPGIQEDLPQPQSYVSSSIQPYITTPKTANDLAELRTNLEARIAQEGILNTPCKLQIKKISKAAKNAFADRAILLNENHLLFEQNCERNVRISTRSTITGTTKVFSYEDLVEAKKKRDLEEVEASRRQRQQGSKRNRKAPKQVLGKRSRSVELEEAIDEIKGFEFDSYCRVLRFN